MIDINPYSKIQMILIRNLNQSKKIRQTIVHVKVHIQMKISNENKRKMLIMNPNLLLSNVLDKKNQLISN